MTRPLRKVFERLIDGRRAGFIFINQEFFTGARRIAAEFGTDVAFRERLQKIAFDISDKNPTVTEKELRRAVTAYCRKMGQIPVKRIQQEFCNLTQQIGCPHFTRTHDLRHLFTSRAQEEGTNPLLVQEILGHATLSMTKRYTHLGMDAKREALERLIGPPNSSPNERE